MPSTLAHDSIHNQLVMDLLSLIFTKNVEGQDLRMSGLRGLDCFELGLILDLKGAAY